MGSWFTNLHIRKSSNVTDTKIVRQIQAILAARHFERTEFADQADAVVAILNDKDSGWYSVFSDIFSFEDPVTFSDFAMPISQATSTDVLGISCFDSDYLYMNLINSSTGTDAWASIGSGAAYGIRRRTGSNAWKKHVDCFDSFKSCIQKKYVCADEVLCDVASFLNLPYEHSSASYEYLRDLELEDIASYYYFRLSPSAQKPELPKLVQYMSSGTPCYIGQPSVVCATNVGGASKGLSVYFLGPYVEYDEITFKKVCFVKCKKNSVVDIPFSLKKVQLKDGQWAYFYHDPGYHIPQKIDDRLPVRKQHELQHERSITVRFYPEGDPRKILDITVVLVPDRNPQGRSAWNVWRPYGSKKEYIEHNNQAWEKMINCENMILHEEDFD